MDNRNDSEKVKDILRIWSQLLTSDESDIWNTIADRDLTRKISLESGIRTPKTFIENEIKAFRNLKATQKIELIKALDKAPEFHNTDRESEISQPVIDSTRLECELDVDEEFLSHYGIQTPLSSFCSFPTQTFSVPPERVAKLLASCTDEVNMIRNSTQTPVKIHTILHRNHKLLFKYMYILSCKYDLRKTLSSVYTKLKKCKRISSKLLKKVCLFLLRKDLIEKSWTLKTKIDVPVNLANSGPMLAILVNQTPAQCVLDTGSTFTLVPFTFWKTLKINPNKLNTSVHFNINSASHSNKNAVLGQIILDLSIKNVTGDEQLIRQNCLILREELDLKLILLGNDFLISNSVNIGYSNVSTQTSVTINNEVVQLLSNEIQTNLMTYYPSSFMANSHATNQNEKTEAPENTVPPELQEKNTEFQEEQLRLKKFFHLDPETQMTNINSFLQSCKTAKENYFNQKEIDSYSVQPTNLDDMVRAEFEKKSIIPDQGEKNPTTKITHLSKPLQKRLEGIFAKHKNLFSRSKHHLGRFVGFKAVAQIDQNSKIKCRQAPRNRILPDSCKQDLLKYKKSGLFANSTGLADHYCANLTLVLRNQVKEQRSNTKADKNLQKHASQTPINEQSKLETKKLTSDGVSESQRSLYRMTIDFRAINAVTTNEKTSQLPSIQSIEANFHDAHVSTIDLSNCYPSIEIEESSRNFFNFYVEHEVWHHARLPQGWNASLAIAQRAVLWTFRDAVLQEFVTHHSLNNKQFPFNSFRQFVQGFVDDLSIFSPKAFANSEELHCLCIEAVFFALEIAGWLIKLEVSTFLNPHFVFLGLFWNLDEQSSIVQNDRVSAILSHRAPRSLPELASRLATLQYYQQFLPLMKRLAIPLYKMIKDGNFIWGKVQAEAYGNLLYLMGLQIRNYIFDPSKPIMAMADTSALETSLVIFQWNPATMNLQIIHTKSILLSTSIRRQSPVHREAFGVSSLLAMAKPYLFQSTAPANFLFNDASSISYIARNKPFSSFLQTLSEELSMYPSLVVIHLPGRALWYCDILSRQHDRVTVERGDTRISKEQATIIPSLNAIKPGAVLRNIDLLDLFAQKIGPEILDVSDSDFRYIQKIDWSLYTNPHQFFTSEREFLIGATLGKLNPELALQLPTLQDIFKIKESGNKLKTKAQKIAFIQQCAEQLQKLPYDTLQLQKIKEFLQQKAVEYKIPMDPIEIKSNFVRHTPEVCNCHDCQNISDISVRNSLVRPAEIFIEIEQVILALDVQTITNKIKKFHQMTCKQAKNILASSILDTAIQYCTNATEMKLNNIPLLVFQYNFDDQDARIQFDGQNVKFLLKSNLKLNPGEIKEIRFNFVTNIQAVPELNSTLQESIAVAPDLHFSPQLCITSLNLANCSDEIVELPESSNLLTLKFPIEQILGIFRELDDILASHQLDRNIVNYNFLKSTAETISNIATEAYIKDLTSFKASTKQQRRNMKNKKIPKNSEEKPSMENIFALDHRNQNTILQSTTLLNGLLKSGFTSKPSEIQQLQISDLKIRNIFEQTNLGKTNSFLILNKILYKKLKNDSLVLCVPELLGKQIIFDSHTRKGFHFQTHQLTALLKPLIYHPDLNDMIKKIVKKCLICTIAAPKRVRTLIGAKRSNYYAPGQCLVVDSCYLPKSQHGYSKALVLVDACTGYIIVYPSTNLLAVTVRKHLLTYLSSHPIPSEIKADFGSEFKQELDLFLAKYNIILTGSKPYSKGSTSNAEAAIRLVKGALRQLCLSHTSNWPELIPILIQGLNNQSLYGTGTSRSQLYFSPYSHPNALKLNNLLFPECIFNDNYTKLTSIIKRRRSRLTTKQILDKTKYQQGNIVLATNVPSSKSDGTSQELSMTVTGIYYVKTVHPSHLRLIGLFTGEERNLPREFCQKISLDNLSRLQFQLQTLQLQKISDNLFRANKYLSPDESKTWNFLLNKNKRLFDNSDPPPIDHETTASSTKNKSSLKYPEQDIVLESESPDQPLNVYGEIEDQDVQKPTKFLRSGRAYHIKPSALQTLRPILKVNLEDYSETELVFDKPQENAHKRANLTASKRRLSTQQSPLGQNICPPGHEENRQKDRGVRASVTWGDTLKIRFNILEGNKNLDYEQPLLIHTESKLPKPNVYLMLSALAVDTSQRELIYETHWSSPAPINEKLILD